VFALVVTAVRNYAGHLSDRFGRVTVAAAGLGLAAAALAALAVASDASSLMAAGVIYGAGFGALTTALLAWCVDVVDEANRGRAMGTYYTASSSASGSGRSAPASAWSGRLRADLPRRSGRHAHRRGARVEPPAGALSGPLRSPREAYAAPPCRPAERVAASSAAAR